jgi:hypothetical protein
MVSPTLCQHVPSAPARPCLSLSICIFVWTVLLLPVWLAKLGHLSKTKVSHLLCARYHLCAPSGTPLVHVKFKEFYL